MAPGVSNQHSCTPSADLPARESPGSHGTSVIQATCAWRKRTSTASRQFVARADATPNAYRGMVSNRFLPDRLLPAMYAKLTLSHHRLVRGQPCCGRRYEYARLPPEFQEDLDHRGPPGHAAACVSLPDSAWHLDSAYQVEGAVARRVEVLSDSNVLH